MEDFTIRGGNLLPGTIALAFSYLSVVSKD